MSDGCYRCICATSALQGCCSVRSETRACTIIDLLSHFYQLKPALVCYTIVRAYNTVHAMEATSIELSLCAQGCVLWDCAQEREGAERSSTRSRVRQACFFFQCELTGCMRLYELHSDMVDYTSSHDDFHQHLTQTELCISAHRAPLLGHRPKGTSMRNVLSRP